MHSILEINHCEKNTEGDIKKSRTLVSPLQNNTDIVIQDSVVLKAKQQIGTAFGCLPLSGTTLFNGDPTYYDEIPDIMQPHRLVRQSGLPNYLGLRILIQTQLNVPHWRYYLWDYFDYNFRISYNSDFIWILTEIVY